MLKVENVEVLGWEHAIRGMRNPMEDWQEILDLAIAAGNTEIQKKAEKQIAKINEKLKF